MTSESDNPNGYADRPPGGEYLERRMTEKRQDEGGMERLVSPHVTLERAVIRLQKDLDDCRTEFEITRKLTPASTADSRDRWDLRRHQSRDTRGSRIGNSTVRSLKPSCARMGGTM